MTDYKFATFGPFKLARKGGISAENLDVFALAVEEASPGLMAAVGIYIFAVKSKKTSSLKPWYVGKTDRGFKKRFTAHQRTPKILDEIADRAPNGELYVILIPRMTPTERFRKRVRNKLGSINALETALIGSCLQVNPKLLNASKTSFFRRLRVPGYLHTGKIKKSETGALALKELLS